MEQALRKRGVGAWLEQRLVWKRRSVWKRAKHRKKARHCGGVGCGEGVGWAWCCWGRVVAMRQEGRRSKETTDRVGRATWLVLRQRVRGGRRVRFGAIGGGDWHPVATQRFAQGGHDGRRRRVVGIVQQKAPNYGMYGVAVCLTSVGFLWRVWFGCVAGKVGGLA